MQDFRHIKAWQRDMSIKSANEVEGHLLKARDLDLLSPEEWQAFTAEVVEIRKMTYGYRRTMLTNAKANETKPKDRSAVARKAKETAIEESDA